MVVKEESILTPSPIKANQLKGWGRDASLGNKEASLLRLASALLVEIDDDWLTGKIYLNMKSE